MFLCEVQCLSAFKMDKDHSEKLVNFIMLGNTLVHVFKLLKHDRNKDRVYEPALLYAHLPMPANNEQKLEQ